MAWSTRRFTIGRASYAAPEPSGVFQGDVDEKGHDARSRDVAPGGGGLAGAAAATGPTGALAGAGGRQPEASTATASALPAIAQVRRIVHRRMWCPSECIGNTRGRQPL